MTTAAVIMFVLTGAGFLVAAWALIDNTGHETPRVLFTVVVPMSWLAVLAGMALVSGILIIRGRNAGRSIAFMFLGAGAIAGLAREARSLAEVVFVNREAVDMFIADTILFVVWMSLTMTPVLLLMSSRATDWFHARRPAPSMVDPTELPSRRPAALYVSLVLLGIIGLIESVRTIVFIARAHVPESGLFSVSFARSVADSAPQVLLVLAAFGWLAAGRDLGRYLSLAVCGFYGYAGLNWLANVATSVLVYQDVRPHPNYWIFVGTAQAAGLTAAATLIVLMGSRIQHWLAERRFAGKPPLPATPPAAAPPPPVPH